MTLPRSRQAKASRIRISSLLVLLIALATVSCSVPNLEGEECIAARESVKQFYSFHIGNDMHPSAEYLQLRQRFLTGSLLSQLQARPSGETDYFTQTTEYPRAFRVGVCKADGTDKTDFEIQLLWRDEKESRQESVHAEAVLESGKWLINKVTK